MSDSPLESSRSARLLRPAGAYYGLVFGAGFLLGCIRVPILVPRVGERAAELMEMPFMLAAIYLAAGFVVRRHGGCSAGASWLAIGVAALTMLVATELALVLIVSGRGVAEYVASRDPVSGSVYLLMLMVFAVMPWLRHRFEPRRMSTARRGG